MNATPSTPASFKIVLGMGAPVRLEASPQEWAAWMDVVSPAGFKALVLLAEPAPSDFPGGEDWAERLLIERGLDVDEAVQGCSALRRGGMLRTEPQRMSDFSAPRYVVNLVKPYRSKPRCKVCGASRLPLNANLVTYVIQRDRYLKVGVTRDLRARLKVLSSREPGVLLPPRFNLRSPTTLIGTTTVPEHDVHEQFAEEHAIGEWFHDSSHLRAGLRDLAGVT